MDYDQDEKSMATLRRRLRKAQSAYYRYKSDYSLYIWEALELEETEKNIQRGSATGDDLFRQLNDHVLALWLTFLIELIHLNRFVITAFLLRLGNVGKVGHDDIYYLAPKQSSSVSLLMICSMVPRYAAPRRCDFLRLIKLRNADGSDQKNIFEDKMGSLTVTPCIGDERFISFYPTFMKVPPEKQSLRQNPRVTSTNSAPPASREGPGNRQYGRVEKPSSKDAVVSKYATLRDPYRTSSGGKQRDHPKSPTGSNYGNPSTAPFGNMVRGTVPSTQPPQPPALIDWHAAPSKNPQQMNNIDGSGFPLNWHSMKSGWQNFETKRLAPMRQGRASKKLQPNSSQTLDSNFQGVRSTHEPADVEDDLDLRLLR